MPTTGNDGRYLATSICGRNADFNYLQQVAQAVDNLGFKGALLPTGRHCEDAWIVSVALAAVTKRMKFIVAFRPSLIAPALAARTASTFDRLSNGRVLVNIVTGGSDADTAADGLKLSHHEPYELTDEFLTIYRGISSKDKAGCEGRDHVRVYDVPDRCSA